MSGTNKGTIARMHATFGFIREDGGTVERFFIPSAVQKTSGVPFERMAPGQRVQFVPIEHPKGPRAIEVKVLS